MNLNPRPLTTDFEIDRARLETPGCEEVVHLNNAGASLVPKVVHDTVIEQLELEKRIGGYEAAERRVAELRDVYGAIADLIGAKSDEIALVENATRAWDMAFYGFRFTEGDRILTSISEYASNYIAFLQIARKTGAEVLPVPNDSTGALSVDALRSMIDDRVKLIAVSHVPTNGGLVNPAAAIGLVAREARVPFLLDACQSIGQMPVDVGEIGCDVLSATGRKYLRGPRGTGFLYVSKSMFGRIEPPFLDLHSAEWTSPEDYRVVSDATRFETWERNVAATLGLGAAARYAMDWGLAAIRDRVYSLADELRASLSAIPGVTVRDLGFERCGLVSFTVAGVDPLAIVERLRERKVNVWKAVASHTLLDMEDRGIESMVRASVHYFNTADEIATLCDLVDAEARS